MFLPVKEAKSKALNRPCNFETSEKSAVAVLSE